MRNLTTVLEGILDDDFGFDSAADFAALSAMVAQDNASGEELNNSFDYAIRSAKGSKRLKWISRSGTYAIFWRDKQTKSYGLTLLNASTGECGVWTDLSQPTLIDYTDMSGSDLMWKYNRQSETAYVYKITQKTWKELISIFKTCQSRYLKKMISLI